jgi:ABC-type hemin transport system ATPase subunit
MKSRKIIALYPVEKSTLKNVDVQKAQKRSHRKLSGGELQSTAQIHAPVLRRRVSRFSV